jgi:ABC-type polysaccharide/polyol phosphate transport system ATPase subunit
MGRNAIEVRDLAKRYFLGEDHRGDLRDTLSAGIGRRGRNRSPRAEIWSLKDVSFDVA